MNDTYYYFSFKTSGSGGGKHHGKHSKTRGKQKHKAQHQIKHDINLLKHVSKHHQSTPAPDIVGDVASHNKMIQAREQTHHNILERRKTKGHPKHSSSGRINLLPANPKNPFEVAKHKYEISDKQKKQETKAALDATHGQQGRGDSTGGLYAYSYYGSVIHEYAPIIVGGGTALLLFILSLNNFKVNI